MEFEGWVVEKPGQPMARRRREATPGPGEVVVEVAGCGVCHTDLGFFYDGVPTRQSFPLVLGHEVSGTVVATGGACSDWAGAAVVIPAVIPCGTCAACEAGRGGICPKQIFPGNDLDGGFATHVRVPARGLCRVPDLDSADRNPHAIPLRQLSVIADAVSTPYQAILRSGLGAGELAVFVGAGGVGGFGVQIAAAMGAHVVAIDVDSARLELLAAHGATLTLDASELSFKEQKAQVKELALAHDVPSFRQYVFETSGTPQGQATAFGLIGHGGYLSVVGFTPAKVELRLSNLMAFDARAQGNWGCLPEHYPAIVDLVLAGEVALAPFVEERPLTTINETFEELHAGGVARRVILVPER